MADSTGAGITPIVMPKWGLSMKEGKVTSWLVEEGAEIRVGAPILEVETDKIANAVEAPDPGTLRRKVAQEGDTLPVKARSGNNWFRVRRADSSLFSMSSLALLYSYRFSRALWIVSSRLNDLGSKLRV